MGFLQFGNLDEEQKYDLSDIRISSNLYVVRHFGTVKLQNGTEIEDPSSSRIQVYDREDYVNLAEQKVKNGEQQKSKFEEMGYGTEVLHDPTA